MKTGFKSILILLLAASSLLAACGGQTTVPTAAALPSVTATTIPTETPLPTWTVVLTATPTLTSTPAPTATPTQTATLLPTATQTWTPAPSSTSIPFVTPTFIPTTMVAGNSLPAGTSQPAPVGAAGGCQFNWFFASRPVTYCPLTAPVNTTTAFLAFETGFMVWFEAEDAIYAVYYDSQAPRWQRFTDPWVEGMQERDPSIPGPQGLWQQPRRGFGVVWRDNPAVRTRLGWALREWETLYTASLQRAGTEGNGAIYFMGPDGRAYMLSGDQTGWEVFAP